MDFCKHCGKELTELGFCPDPECWGIKFAVCLFLWVLSFSCFAQDPMFLRPVKQNIPNGEIYLTDAQIEAFWGDSINIHHTKPHQTKDTIVLDTTKSKSIKSYNLSDYIKEDTTKQNPNNEIIQIDTAQAYDYQKMELTIKTPKTEAWKTIAIYTASIALNAIGDGQNTRGNKTLGHALNALSIGTLLASPFILKQEKQNWYKYILSYMFIRAAIFDPVYNISAGNRFDYVGNSNLTDKFQQKFGSCGLFVRGTCLTIGLAIPLKEVR